MGIINRFRIETYNIGIIHGDAESLREGVGAGAIRWLRHNYRDRFFADPFLIKRDDNYYYILVEEYSFWKEKGIITLLTVDQENFSLCRRKVLIEESYHLSYPFCHENDGQILPESSASGQTYVYPITPDLQLSGEKRLIAEAALIDPTIIKKGGNEWLFAVSTDGPQSCLRVYYRTDQDTCFCEIRNSPVKETFESARPAGRFFTWKDRLIRPAQDCRRRYGHQVKLMDVSSIGFDGIIEQECLTLNSASNPPYHETFHTFNVYDGFILVDGSCDRIRFPMKLMYRGYRLLRNSVLCPSQ